LFNYLLLPPDEEPEELEELEDPDDPDEDPEDTELLDPELEEPLL
jgi:hypothetical protein